MAAAFFWGILASSSLILGGVIALRVDISRRSLGLVMGFGSGVLISAVAYELVEEASATAAGGGGVALGLLAGCATFFIGDTLIDRMGGEEPADGSPLAIVLGIVLDGIPESVVLGLTVLEGGTVSAAFLVAVLLSNLPEAIAASTELAAGGWASRRIIGLWTLVTLVAGIASLAGYVLFDGASASSIAFVLAFAGGAILTMLADTMMPEAFEHGGKLVGVFTTLGFALAFAISALE
jgi:zinc transporter, ZIP family